MDRYKYFTVGTWDPQNLLNISSSAIDWNDDINHIPESVCSHPCANGYYTDFVPDHGLAHRVLVKTLSVMGKPALNVMQDILPTRPEVNV